MLRQEHNDYRESANPEVIIQKYIQEVENKYLKRPLTHEYIGQIYIKLDQGFDVLNIEFSKSLFTFKVYVKGEVADLVHTLCSPLGKLNRYEEKMIFQIEGQNARQQFKRKI